MKNLNIIRMGIFLTGGILMVCFITGTTFFSKATPVVKDNKLQEWSKEALVYFYLGSTLALLGSGFMFPILTYLILV